MATRRSFRVKVTRRKLAPVKSNTRKINKLIRNVETLFVNTSQATAVLPAAVTMVPITGISQGDTNRTRDGNKVTAKSISIDLTLESTVAATSSWVRVFVIKANNNNGQNDLPVLADIFLTNINNDVRQTSPFNPEHVGPKPSMPFKVLKNWLVYVSNANTTKRVRLKYFKKLGFTIRFDGNAGTNADIVTNALYLVYVADDANASFRHNAIFRFTDT